MNRTVALCVSLYLSAVVAANLAVDLFGQAALIVTAFVLIPFDLVTRDILHEKWRGPHLWPHMLALIACGSILTVLVSWDAHRIALASTCAFFSASTVNALVYRLLDHRKRFVRMNGSNVVASVVDSVVFPFIAFQTVSPVLCIGQSLSKIAGGLVWGLLFVYVLKKFDSKAGAAYVH